jgi:hypothetical protein
MQETPQLEKGPQVTSSNRSEPTKANLSKALTARPVRRPPSASSSIIEVAGRPVTHFAAMWTIAIPPARLEEGAQTGIPNIEDWLAIRNMAKSHGTNLRARQVQTAERYRIIEQACIGLVGWLVPWTKARGNYWRLADLGLPLAPSPRAIRQVEGTLPRLWAAMKKSIDALPRTTSAERSALIAILGSGAPIPEPPTGRKSLTRQQWIERLEDIARAAGQATAEFRRAYRAPGPPLECHSEWRQSVQAVADGKPRHVISTLQGGLHCAECRAWWIEKSGRPLQPAPRALPWVEMSTQATIIAASMFVCVLLLVPLIANAAMPSPTDALTTPLVHDVSLEVAPVSNPVPAIPLGKSNTP